jgi:hypothetical protein
MDNIPINVPLISNWYNWIVILLMVYIVGLAAALLFHKQILPTTGSGS